MIGAGPADLLQLISLVQGGLAAPAAPVETEWAPFIAGPIVAGKEDQRVVEVAALFEVVKDPADPLVDMVQHGGEGRHAVGEVFAAPGRQ